MAYSMYAYLKPEILEAGIPFWDEYFNAYPWFKTPQSGDVNLFTYVKPRIENGTDRFIAFMDALVAAGDNLVELYADTCINDKIKSLAIQYGYADLAEKIQFE